MEIDTWVNLSDEGKKELGTIFPEGRIPSKSILSQIAKLEGKKENKEVYKVDISCLTNEQFERCIDYIMLKNKERGLGNVNRNIVSGDIKRMGFIPLQSKYVCGAGTKNVAMFL